MLLGAPAIAQTTVSAGFENGVIGEYRNAAHQPTRLNTFATLGITGAVISDTTDDGRFGGSQGNDYSVTVTFQFSNGSTSTFNAAVNWRDTQGSTVHGIGLTVSGGVDDGTSYVAASGLQKTYLLQFVSSTRAYADTASGDKGDVISGNAATTGLFDELNTYATSKPASINPAGLTSIITASPGSILANGTSTSTVTVQLKDVNGNNLSAGGNTVTLSTNAGSLSGVIDNGNGTYTATLTSSTSIETATITGVVDGSSIVDTASVDFVSNSSISGTVRNGGGNGLSGRTVRLLNNSGQVLQTVTTGSGGAYTFSNVAPGTYKIEFESSGNYKAKARSAVGNNNSHFVTSISVADASTDLTGVDAVVIDPAGVVYDTVTRQPVAGAVVTFNYNGSLVPNSSLDQTLGGPNTQTTSADGQYSFVLNSSASDGVYTLNVTEPSGYTFQSLAIPVSSGPFNPGLGGGIVAIQPQATAPTGSDDTTYYLDFSFVVGASPATTSNGVINNHIPLDPTPSVSVTNTTDASEPSTNGVFTVNLSTASATDTVVGYSVAGTATAGTDYTALSGAVTISANTTSATISVPVIDDSLVEGGETVIITLTGVTSGTASLSSTAADLTATNTISDDDTGLNAAPVFTNQNAGSGTSYSFDYAEGSSAGDVLGQVSASDAEGDALTFSITGGDPNSWYAINGSTGEITLTAAGAASLANDYEQTSNTQTLTVTVSDGTNSTTVQVALNETDVNDSAPVFTNQNAGSGTSYSFDYAEGSSAG
ncbi:invasin domain 3-containing protein, partial [Altererythrobacter litoralis]|nr:invasin domain 3-containing protein [Erythrobacteraceae bacterium 1XM1-14]